MIKVSRFTIIAYTLAFGIAIGYWAAQENLAAEVAKAQVVVAK